MNRPRHNRLLLINQLVLLALIGALAWQGISAARTQERMVRGLMGDYALLIAENTERSFNAVLGYRTIYALLQGIQEQPELFPMETRWVESAFSRSTPLPVNEEEILLVAARNTAGNGLMLLWNGEQTGWGESWPELTSKMDPRDLEQTGFRIHHPTLGSTTHTVLSANFPGRSVEMLIWFDPELVANRIGSTLAKTTLLPAVLGDPERLRPHINLALHDPAGRLVWSTPVKPRGYLSRARVIGGDYSGLLAGFEISASINPAIADELVIGGLPYDWLPLFLGLVVVTLLLGVLTFVLTRRQREVQAMRDDFVARVSHELRTPLTQIRMFAESLLHGRILDDAARRDALAVINRETLRLGHMVDSILRFESPSDHQPAPEHGPFSLQEWGQSLKTRFQPLLDAGDVRLDFSVPDDAATRCNRDALTQVAGNLLDNSLKYGPRGQTIRVGYGTTDAGWRLEFRDEGPGIPAGRSEAVFEPYRRLERDRANGSTGTGIGLGVARDIARSMGGDLAFKPDSSSGCFVLTMREPDHSEPVMSDG